MQRQALTVDSGSQRRKYKVEISKFEYVKGALSKRVDGVDVRVYPPLLLAVEKLRALVQQHNDYVLIPAQSKRSRSRDLYDIWVISDYFALHVEEHLPTVEAVFAVKQVDLGLLGRFRELEGLHGSDWADVENSVAAEIGEFDFYFDYVARIASELHSKWMVDSP